MTINVQQIAARTKLCVLSTGAWRAVRLHKRETREENRRHSTNAAKVLVRVTDHQALKNLGKLHAQAYTEHRRLTLPTVQDGMRLLPVGREMEHASKMTELSDRHKALVADFVADYENERDSAVERLNGLYDPSMWPSRSTVASKFTFSTRYLSTPTEGAWGDWLSESARAAESEMRDRITEALERVRDRCRSDGRLYASVFDTIRELVALAPDFDLTGDPEIAALIAGSAPLTRYHATTLRDDKAGRRDVAAQADRILATLGNVS